MSNLDTGEVEERIIDELDGVLPGEIDRRKFLQGSAAALAATMFPGAAAAQDSSKVVFTTPWKKEPSWGHAHVAEGKGYWEDAGVPGVNATRGNGSDTEIQQIGTGNKEMGVTSLTTALKFIPPTQDTQALNVKMIALGRGRPLLSLIWRKDEMNSRSDLAGKTVLLASGFAAASWPVYPQLAGVDPNKITTQESTEEVGPAKLASNQVQAVWGSIDLLPAYEEQVNAELGVTPMTAFGPFYGYPVWVNGNWFENKENNVEFTSNVLTGYFKALKWGLLNQEAYLTYLKQQVNPNLRTWTQEELVGQHAVNCAQAVTLEMKDQGLGYFTQDGVQFSVENAGPALVDNYEAIPSASELVDRRPWEQSEKVTFSDSEWNTLAENAGRIWGLFKQAESGTPTPTDTSG